jgi:HEAT repeat protein
VALKDMCHDSSLSGQIRAEAGEFLLGTGSEDCHDAVASIALVGDGVARQRALVALESFRQLSQKERAGDVEIMCRGLTDADSGVRLEASEALGCFGEISGIQCLRDAIVHEPEDHVRSSMQRAIDKLDKVGRTDSTKEKPRGNPGDVQDK